jgi:hypothetical protein
MKIGILAWGSLIWERGNLLLETDWAAGGPELPIEFSRVSKSRSGALTLVIDQKNGIEIPTYFATSSYQDLNEAINNLGEREGSDGRCIGYVNCITTEKRSIVSPEISNKIHDWGEKNNFDVVIWTDLPSNFDSIDKTSFSDINDPSMKFTVDNAQIYLHGLRAPGDEKAREYIKNASPRVETKLRKRIYEDPWLYVYR